MIGDVIELSIVVKNLDAAVERFQDLFELKVYEMRESKKYGFKNAILPLGRGHIDLIQPTDPSSAVARFLDTHGEGVYLVGFETDDITESSKKLREKGCRVTQEEDRFAWVHPKDLHGVFVELKKPERYQQSIATD